MNTRVCLPIIRQRLRDNFRPLKQNAITQIMDIKIALKNPEMRLSLFIETYKHKNMPKKKSC